MSEPPPWQPLYGDPYAPTQREPYPPAPAAQWGPYAPYPPAYSAYGFDPRIDSRPGIVLASAVLGYVTAGLLILAGALLLFGASVVSSLDDVSHSSIGYGPELAFDGVLNFVAAGLLIAGGVMITGRKPGGRVLLAIGSVVVMCETIYWLVRFDFLHAEGTVVYAVLFGALAVLIVAFAWTSAARAWLAPTRY